MPVNCGGRTPGTVIRVAVIHSIRVYQRWLSPLTGPTCRFHPSCSSYTLEAVIRYGAVKGLWRGVCRVCRCHPFHPGGYDPLS